MSALETAILFVLPGVLGMTFSRQFGTSGTRKLSDYEVTLYGSALGIPIFFVLFGLYDCFFGSISLSSFIKVSETPWGLLAYLVVSIVVSFTIGVIIGKWLNKGLDWFVNLIRHRDATKHRESVWDAFTGDRSEALVRVYTLADKSNSYVGILKRWSDAGDAENAMMLLMTDEYQNLNPYLEYPQRSYVNTATNTVYEYFNEEDVLQAQQTLKEEDKRSSS